MKIAVNLQFASADAGVLRRRAAGGEERHRFHERLPWTYDPQRDRFADDSVSRTVRPAAAEEAWFDVNMMQKDMLLAMEMGRKLNVPVPTTAVSNEFLTAARGMGWEKKDFAVVFDVLARMSGVQNDDRRNRKKLQPKQIVAPDVPADGRHPPI
jgi:hypothetical protein